MKEKTEVNVAPLFHGSPVSFYTVSQLKRGQNSHPFKY